MNSEISTATHSHDPTSLRSRADKFGNRLHTLVARHSVRGKRSIWARVLPSLAVLLGVVILLQLGTIASGIDATILPSPLRVLSAGWDDRKALATASWISLRETLLGLLLAVAVSFLISAGIESSKFMRRSIYPVLIGSQTVPVVAVAPLVVIWFGFGE